MKQLITSVAIFLVLWGFCLCHSRYLSTVTGDTADMAEAAMEEMENGEPQKAAETCREALSHWKSHRVYLGTVLNHSDSDPVVFALARLEELAEKGDISGFSAQWAELSEELVSIAESEKATLENILVSRGLPAAY